MKAFIEDTFYRCVWTFCEGMSACMTIGKSMFDIDWIGGLSVSVVMVLACMIKQVAVYCKQHINSKYDAEEDGEWYDDDCE